MTYVVKGGDTLSAIAKRYGTTWQDIWNANRAVIGNNPNLIRPGQNLTIGSQAPTPAPTPAPAASTGATQGSAAGNAVKKPSWDTVLPWEQYFDENLAKSAAEQRAARYFAPIAEQARQSLEGQYADRGLTRSGLRGQAIGQAYGDIGAQQQQEIESDFLEMQKQAQQERNLMQEQYDKSEGPYTPSSTSYGGYDYTPAIISAGSYGKSYQDWLNNYLKV